MPLYNADARLAAPIRLHTLTPEAEAARVAVREYRARQRAAIAGELVTKHPHPHSETVPKSASDLAKDAEAHGFEVRVVFGHWTLDLGTVNEREVEAVKVAGFIPGRAGFQAVWVAGKAKTGAWYEPRAEWVGVAAIKERVKR